ncbi:hypothetical protein yc1106_07644 [Curvularia clavata]|uniref:HTH CENPB-type domain-containing protein n=1 Tax=Curvularia clavata TaxID=95742 RepID=A0A9Q8ZDS9_CURCL|nr:hypothetical protein yc1106_07644 [Curvularia clavata]
MNLTKLEEEVVVEHILDLGSRGFPPRLADVANMANSLRAERNLGQVGQNWPSTFVKRRPELKVKFNRKYDYKRALCEDPKAIQDWFGLVANMKAKYGIQDDDTYNFDETGFMMGQITPGAVVTASERRGRPKTIQPGNREWATVIQGINATGWTIPPFIILKARHHLSSWYKDGDIPQNWVIGVSENGWTTNELGLAWLKHFDEHTKKKVVGTHRLLFIDGHESHNSLDFQKYCKDNKIVTLCMPPHSSHLLQPLDVGCFAPLKQAYGRQVESLMRTQINHITKQEFLPCFRRAFDASFIASNVQGGFRGAGLVPFDPERVISALNVQLRTPSPLPVDTQPWLSQTPRNTLEIGSQSTLVKQRIQRHLDSSPTSMVEAFEKVSKGAAIIAHKLVLAQKRISELEAANAAATRRKSHKRKRVQAEGTLTVEDGARLTALQDFGVRSDGKKSKKQKRAEPRMQRQLRQLRREDYTVGWVCALSVELAAAMEMLDETHAVVSDNVGDSDENLYTLGSIAGHNVVIVCLPAGHIGNNPAAAVATQLRTAFKGIQFGLMVGIGGGVPSACANIQLGDVVVSQPHSTFGGVVQYDFGRRTPNGLERIGSLNSPPQILLSAISTIRASSMVNRSTLSDHLSILKRNRIFQRPRAGLDPLLKSAYNHEHNDTCSQCRVENHQPQSKRKRGAEVMIHYGTIASGNQVMKDAAERDRISAELDGVLCFEMEAAGLMNRFPCLVIRGISDYADSHKNDKWQAHAAGTAAAYAKELLSVIRTTEGVNAHRAEDSTSSGGGKHCRQPSSPDHASNKRLKTTISNGVENGSAKQWTVPLPTHSREPSRTPLNDEQRHSLLESLGFDQIDARQMTIKTAHAKTCKWLLQSEQYVNWLDTTKLDKHHGFLWIKGKAGTGKSTLMKYALANARKAMKDYTILSFFFNARGEDIEKSTIGTYRSLLIQLLDRLPALWSIFDSLSLSTSKFTKDYQWNTETLKTLLEQAVQSLEDSSVICFIDALDECEEDQVRDMVQFFEHIGDLVVSHGIRFQVCFSSRHYPHITIRNGLELVLEGQEGHSQDITNYVETELKIGKSKTAQQIRAELQEKSSGIFMWVVLVVGILNTEFDRGQIFALREKLKAIPGDLHKLFSDILTRDSRNKDILVLCIQWVLFAKQPLSPEQLYHALLLNINSEAIFKLDYEETTRDDIKRFILDFSKGLAEATVSKEPRVQFIHESVRDFLLKENGLGKIWPELGSNFQNQSHERLKQNCLDYMSIDVVMRLEIPDKLAKASSQQAAALRKLATQKFPFLEYAVRNVLYHADTAEGGGISQACFLDSFPIPRWVKLDNLFEKFETRRHTERVNLLYLLAELNMANLIRAHHSVTSCLYVEKERYGCAFFAANATGGQEAMQACIEGLKAAQSQADHGWSLLEENSRHEKIEKSLGRDFKYSRKGGILIPAVETGSVAVCSYLIGLGNLNLDSNDAKGRTPLYVAAEKGASVLSRMLLDKGANVNAQGGHYGNALQAASAEGHKDIVTLLLERGANVNAQGGFYSNALYAASDGGYKEIVTLLLDKDANVNAQGRLGSALHAALAEGHQDIATLLLDKGADINAQSEIYGNPLQAALSGSHKDVVMLLLDKGANVNAQGGDYGNALQGASAKGYEDIVTLLLGKGIDVNIQGGDYGNALQAASTEGHKDIVMLLLNKGADVNAQGGDYINALYAASDRGHKDIVMLLLNKGADVNAQGGDYTNALYAASDRGHKEIVTLLLDRGANVNAQGGHKDNSLYAAIDGGYTEIATLLVERGANINARGGLYGHPLGIASARGDKEIVTLLLDKGAKVNAQSRSDDNALCIASDRGYKEIVTLLLDRGADVNAEGGLYGNALQVALRSGHQEVATLLLKRGASRTSK